MIKLNRRSFARGSLMLGAASPLVLSACSSASSSERRIVGRRRHPQLADLVGSLLQRPARQGRRADQDHRAAEVVLRQRRCVPARSSRPGRSSTMVSGDALWVKKYKESGLIRTVRPGFDRRQLRAVLDGQELRFPQRPEGAIGYPFSWSTVQIYYNPAKVKTAADVVGLTDRPQYKGLIVAENIPTRPDGDRAESPPAPSRRTGMTRRRDLVGGRLADSDQAEHGQARDAEQRDHLDDGQWRGRDRLHQPGHRLPGEERRWPELQSAYPPEGTIGFIDSEMITAKGKNKALIKPFLDAMQRSEFIVENFTTNWRPLFNESARRSCATTRRQLTTPSGCFMDDPEKALAMTLKGPAQDQQAYTEAFNRVFGA